MILSLFPEGKAEVLTGTTTAVAGVGFSWTHAIFPIISEIAVIAGCIVALHGVYVIIHTEILKWKNRRNLKE